MDLSATKSSDSQGSGTIAEATRRSLLRQRMAGCDVVETSSLTRDPMSSNNVQFDPPTPQPQQHRMKPESPVRHERSGKPARHQSMTCSVPSKALDDTRKLTEEMTARLESEKSLRQEAEQRFQKMKEIALEFIEKYAVVSQEMNTVEILQQQQRLGSVTTHMSGSAKWSGGIEVMRIENQIFQLSRQLTEGKNELKGMRKGALQSELKELRQQLKKLEDERIDLAIQMRCQNDQAMSKYRVRDILNDGKYVLVKYLGRGGFSEVWEAFDLQTTLQRVAIKIQRMNPEWSQMVKQNFLRHTGREINIMSSTQHANVVSFYEHFYIGDDTVALVMECCNGGDLAQLLRKRGKIAEKEAKRILLEVMQGLAALRSKENYVIHYDLKPANILFTHDGTVKITDFGLSKIVECDVTAIELTSQGTGTYYYAAPETFQRGKGVLITPSVDTWSLGIIFYEMLYGQRPFGTEMSQMSFAQQSDQVFGESIQFPATVKVSDAAKDFIRLCLDRDPMQRPNLEQLLQCSYCK